MREYERTQLYKKQMEKFNLGFIMKLYFGRINAMLEELQKLNSFSPYTSTK